VQDPVWKKTKAKRAGSMAQVVEHLPSNHEALSSNSSINNKTKQKYIHIYIHTHILYLYIYTLTNWK
jgi:hypothetical protein